MEFSDYVESRANAATLTGDELIAGSQSGQARKWKLSDMIALFGGIGSAVQTSPAFNFHKYRQYIMTLRAVGSATEVTHVTGEDLNLLQYWLSIEVTNVAGTVKFPNNYKMSDARWEVGGVAKTWFPDFTGVYSGWVVWDGIGSWNLTLSYNPFGEGADDGPIDGFDEYEFDSIEFTS